MASRETPWSLRQINAASWPIAFTAINQGSDTLRFIVLFSPQPNCNRGFNALGKV